MIYYKRNLGGYAKATRHLSLLEHGVYCMLLDVYYTTEKPLPVDARAVYRLVGARSDEERSTVDTVLSEFFTSAPDGFHQPRCDEEIANKKEQVAKNTETGKLGGRPKQITDSVIPENPQASATVRKESETDSGNQTDMETELKGNHEPSTINQLSQSPDGLSSPADAGLPQCPHRELIELFGKHLPELPQPRPELWGDSKSAESLRARWKWVLTAKKKNGQRYATNRAEALDFFDRFFAYVAGNDFLAGRVGDFTCSMQWLCKAGNFEKVIQGNYEKGRKQ